MGRIGVCGVFCGLILSVAVPAPVAAGCGDAIIELGEACDDGNSEARGWCSADCTQTVGPTRRLYANGGDGAVHVVDVQSQTVVASIPIGSPSYEVAIEPSPDGHTIATFNTATNSVILIDVGSGGIVGTVSLGTLDIDHEVLAFSPDSRKLYLSAGEVSLAVVDVATRQVERLIDIDIFPEECPDGETPSKANALAASPDGLTLYAVTLRHRSHLLEIDLETDAVRCMLLGDPEDEEYPESDHTTIVLAPDGKAAFVSHDYSYTWLSRVALPRGRYLTQYEHTRTAYAAKLSCDAERLIVPTDYDTIAKIDPVTLAFSETAILPLLNDRRFVAATPDARALFWPATSPGIAWADVETNTSVHLPLSTYIDGIAMVTLPERSGDLCPPIADASCRTGFAAASLLIDEAVPGRESLAATFKKGPALAQADFGNPINPPCGNTRYALCIYDATGDLAGELDVSRAGHRCSGSSRMCWNANGGTPPKGKGYGYRDADLSASGVAKMRLRSGEAGKSAILVKAKNDASAGSTFLPTGLTDALRGSTQATMQLITSDAECFSVRLEDVKRADLYGFRGKM